MPGILVVAETSEGALAPISGELLGAARQLSSEGVAEPSSTLAPSSRPRYTARSRAE